MRKNPIRFADIQKRQQRITLPSDDKAAITEAAINTAKEGGNRDTMIERLFTLCCNTENAERCMPYLIKYINEASQTNRGALVTCFTNYIAPVIENCDTVLSDLNNIIDMDVRATLIEAVQDDITIDKILENHAKISKRFDVNSYVLEHAYYADPIDTSIQICEWIDTYDMPPYAKLQTAIEETAYVFQKCGVEYDRADVLQTLVEYFLLGTSLTAGNAQAVLESSKVITEEDTSKVRYVFKEYASDEISKVIQKCKNDDINESKFKKAMNAIYTKTPEQLIDGTPNILVWIRKLLVLSTLGANVLVGAVVVLVDKFIQMEINRKQVDKVYNAIKSEKEKTKKAIEKASDSRKEKLEKYSDALDDSLAKMDEYRDRLFTDDELKSQDDIENEAASAEPLTLNEFENFKFNKIADTAADAAKYIKDRYSKPASKEKISLKNVLKKAPDEDIDKDGNPKKKKPSPISDALMSGLKSISSHFTETLFDANMNLFDAVLVTFNVSESKAEKAYDLMSSICEDTNNRFGKDGVRFYSNTAGDNCEIHLVNTNPIMLKESEKEYADCFAASDINTVSEFFYLTKLIEMYVGYKPDCILIDLLESDLGFDEAYLIMNLQKYSGINEADEVWDKLKEKYTNKNYAPDDYQKINENTLINGLSYEFNGNDIPFDIQVEACGLMRGLLNEAFDTSAVKVAIQGMKDKVKNLGAKEKEISRSMDVAANGLTRSIENALTNDRREAIIKGSIIPSFSKCVKTAIAAGGVAVIVDPMVAVIGLIGGLAGSRYLNNRERMLLLDEIEVELKVVEKELQRAENDDDMQKYRKLLTYQKKLKKEDFKLRYNISRKMGKDYITRSGKDDDE